MVVASCFPLLSGLDVSIYKKEYAYKAMCNGSPAADAGGMRYSRVRLSEESLHEVLTKMKHT